MNPTNSEECPQIHLTENSSSTFQEELHFLDGIGCVEQSSYAKFGNLLEIKRKRKEEELENEKLTNKVSLLQKEEQRVLNKIICIGTLKNKINEVKQINENYKIAFQKKKKKKKKKKKRARGHCSNETR